MTRGWTSDLLRIWARLTAFIAAGLFASLLLVDREHWPVLFWLAGLAELWNTTSLMKSWLFAVRYQWFWWKR